MCFSPKVHVPKQEMQTQAPTPVAAAETAPTGIQYGGQNETVNGNKEAVVDRQAATQGKSALTVTPNAPSTATNTAGATGGASNVSTEETQPTAFDKLRRLQRVKSGATNQGGW